MVAEVESIRLLLNYSRLQTFTIDRYRDPTNWIAAAIIYNKYYLLFILTTQLWQLL